MQSLWNKSKQLAQAGSDVVSAGVSAGTDALAKSTGAAMAHLHPLLAKFGLRVSIELFEFF